MKSMVMVMPVLAGIIATVASGVLTIETVTVTEGNLYGYPLPWVGVFGFLEPPRTHYIWGNFVVDVLFYAAIGYGLVLLTTAPRMLRSRGPTP